VGAHCLRAAISTCRDLSLPLIYRRERSTRPCHWRADGIRQASFIADNCVRLYSCDWNSSFGFGKLRRNDCPPSASALLNWQLEGDFILRVYSAIAK
jgi:hypothetical protein